MGSGIVTRVSMGPTRKKNL
ncbi:uncharacterized protein G2W53_028129 [Senna tora]|uniref:Uncharacterized protein n=1 Tax=Senna tora TaxID=362788 RepID=A0A834W8F4_9FABA|nr:uncharacterized protein G2W53_028129 [Senna tora]